MIHRSPYPDVEIPDVPFHELVLARADALGDKPALIDGPSGRAITFAQLKAGVMRVAANLAARGFKKGDVLAIFAPNCPEFALAFFGASAAGGIVTTLSPLATEDDLAGQMKNAGARLLVTIPAFLDRAAPAAKRIGIEEVFVFGEAEQTTPFASLLAGSAAPPNVRFDPANEIVALPYSSGKTGLC